LPSTAYAIGYIKEYCKFLKVDYKEYIDKLKRQQENGKLKSGASLNLITDKEFLPSIYIVLACIVITLLIYLLFYLLKN
jgi:cytoskeletal protein RodZ